MTEEAWLNHTATNSLIGHAATLSKRKTRLCLAACCRRLWPNLTEVSRRAVEASEAYADRVIKKKDLLAVRKAATSVVRDSNSTPAEYAAASVARDPLVPEWIVGRCAYAAQRGNEEPGEHVETSAQIELIRDVFGNPFRPVTIDPSWRTSTATAIAQQMYDARDFGAMPILADALQDAGCDHEDILTHCRDPQEVHVRGCWVVDLVLEKE